MACGNNEVSGEALASQPTPVAHPDPERMIETSQIWTSEYKQSAEEPDRLDVWVTTTGVFEPGPGSAGLEFRGTGHRELAKAIFDSKEVPNAEKPMVVQAREKQYTHLVGRVEREGDTEVLVINPPGSNVGLMRGSGVAGREIRGWNPSRDDDAQAEI